MIFESKLKELVESYQVITDENSTGYQDKIKELLRKEIQASDIEFNNDEFEPSCKMVITAPGLQTYWGYSGYFREDAVTYEGRNGEETLHPRENGFVEAIFKHSPNAYFGEDDDYNKKAITNIYFTFGLELKIPEKKEYDKANGIYLYELKQGYFKANFHTGDGRYVPNAERDKRLITNFFNLKITNRNNAVNWINIPANYLGTGTLTSFFEDFGYTGLDKLVEK